MVKRGWLSRLVGLGRIRPVVRETLEDEGFLVLDEGIAISIVYSNYRAPGKRVSARRQRTRGAIAVTESRLIAFALLRKIINVRLDDPRLARLGIGLEAPDVLVITVDPSVFHDDSSGEVVYRFHTDRAPEILSILESRRQA